MSDILGLIFVNLITINNVARHTNRADCQIACDLLGPKAPAFSSEQLQKFVG